MKNKRLIFLSIINILLIFVLSCVGYCFNSYINQYKVASVMVKDGVISSMKVYWDSYLSYYIMCIISIVILSILIILLCYNLIKEIMLVYNNETLKSSRKAKKKEKLEKKLEELEGEE